MLQPFYGQYPFCYDYDATLDVLFDMFVNYFESDALLNGYDSYIMDYFMSVELPSVGFTMRRIK